MSKPVVVLTLSPLTAASTDQAKASRGYYVDALVERGADVRVVEVGETPPAEFDGVCLSGGGDVDPREYGETNAAGLSKRIDAERDRLELSLARAALSRDVPVLGICRGFQLLNVALKGSLIQDLPGHQVAEPGELIPHDVRVDRDSKLAAAVGDRILVNSRHHQGVDERRLAPGLRATVHHDGLVEAFESTRHDWVVGVQWHPERPNECDPAARRIFDAFVEAASRKPAHS